MTDLHSHILPGMDDGAPDLAASLELLEMEAIQGVRNIALTSHYHGDAGNIDGFLARRAEAFEVLRGGLGELGEKLRLKLGCEVRYSPRLMHEPVFRLCLEGTDVLLLELPMDQNPAYLPELLDFLRSDGIIPLIAHVERYRYVHEDPRILARWVDMGAYAQVNGSTLLRGGEVGAMAMKYIKWNLVHAVATDAHSVGKRPPILRQALHRVAGELGKDKAVWLRQNAEDLFEGREPEYRRHHSPRRVFGAWL